MCDQSIGRGRETMKSKLLLSILIAFAVVLINPAIASDNGRYSNQYKKFKKFKRFNLGEFWVANQSATEDELYVFTEKQLKRYGRNRPKHTIHLHRVNGQTGFNPTKPANRVNNGANRLHIIGFNNYPGIHPKSRAVLSYLSGKIQYWKTNVLRGRPRLVATVSGGPNLHMGGPSPDNKRVAVVATGNRHYAVLTTDYDTDTYSPEPVFIKQSRDLLVSPNAPRGTQATWDAILTSAQLDFGNPDVQTVCTNWDSSSRYTYVTLDKPRSLIIIDNDAPVEPSIINAFGPDVITSEGGCGLVTDPSGKFMWTNAGGRAIDAETEEREATFRWPFRRIGKRHKPKTVFLNVDLHGDAHGSQFAGRNGDFHWSVMRVDGTINVVSRRRPRLVNTFNYETPVSPQAGGDVLDRSSFGKYMFLTIRGSAPLTAIPQFVSPDRSAGITVIKSRRRGYTGRVINHVPLRSQHGTTTLICLDEDHGDDHDHGAQGAACEDEEIVFEVDAQDPHGGKSLHYLTGGF